jgi:hypothetical protein
VKKEIDMSRDCDDGCGELASERLRYFTGRHMTARDFRDEQSYHRSHRHLHNRMLHGWGVVCGLHVHPHPNPECRTVKVDCGFALDCCGREIAVPKQIVPPEIPWKKRPQEPAEVEQEAVFPIGSGGPATTNNDDRRWYLLLCLHYEEKPIESMPVLYNEQNCDPQRREYSRIREGYGFAWHWVRKAELAAYYWKSESGGCPDPKDGPPCIEDDCGDGGGEGPCCLDPECPPHHCVPIALIEVGDEDSIGKIITVGRPSLEPPPHTLTHICRINWPHGGVLSRQQVADLKELRIRFDRRLKPPPDDARYGVNDCTFLVQYGMGSDFEDLDFVASTEPPHVDHDCVAVYGMDKRGGKPFSYLEGHTVFITLKCDFILDCHDVAVDGNHIGGSLPSGDGIRGGTFESWFRVVSDAEWDGHYGHHHGHGHGKDDPEKEQS